MSNKYHLIRPTNNEEMYCKKHQLQPFRDWINLFDDDTFLLGPFNFATFNGRQSKDRISTSVWSALQSQSDKFDNSVPKTMNADNLVYYLDTQYHSMHSDDLSSQAISNILFDRYMSY